MNPSLTRTLAGGLGATFLAAHLLGCAGDPSPQISMDNVPVGVQLVRATPSLAEGRFSTLLDFESASDDVFTKTDGGHAQISHDRAHTGAASLKLSDSPSQLTVKLGSVLGSRPFPGSWTLAGAYFYVDRPTRIVVSCGGAGATVQSRSVIVPPQTWMPVITELASVTSNPAQVNESAGPPALSFAFPDGAPSAIWCDDVMLIDNRKVFVAPVAGDPVSEAHPWTIRRSGFAYLGDATGLFSFSLQSAEASDAGWALDEANAMRARFHSASPARTLTVYADGRAYWNGTYRPMSAAARNGQYADCHISPAEIVLPEEMGKVLRNTPGDSNNDGYNEATGSYRIRASGARLELSVRPRGATLISPVLEIEGLPPGKPLVTLEGRLVDQVTRTASGTLLVELPNHIDRNVTVSVSVQ